MKKEIGILKKDGKIIACDPAALVWLSASREIFEKYFELIPTEETINLKECEIIGSMEL